MESRNFKSKIYEYNISRIGIILFLCSAVSAVFSGPPAGKGYLLNGRMNLMAVNRSYKMDPEFEWRNGTNIPVRIQL